MSRPTTPSPITPGQSRRSSFTFSNVTDENSHDATPRGTKRGRFDSGTQHEPPSRSSSRMPPPLSNQTADARLKNGGGYPGYPSDAWATECVSVLQSISEGARATHQATDEILSMNLLLGIIDELHACANSLARLVPEGVLSYDQPFPSSSARPSMPSPSDANSIKDDIKHMLSSLEASLSNRIASVERQVRSQSGQSRPPRPPQSSSQQSPQPAPASTDTYATAAAKADSSNPAAPRPPSATRPAARPHALVKFIVRFQGRFPPDHQRKSPLYMFTELNHALEKSPTAREANLSILGADWNRSGNINLVFPPGTKPSLVHKHIDIIRPIVSHGVEDVRISHDEKWSKVVCSRIPSHGPDGRVWEPTTLGVMLRRNPHFKNIQFTQEPRFIQNPAEGLPALSAIVFAFEDPDGSRARELLKTPMFFGGVQTPTRMWKEKPKFIQCGRCQALGHATKTCAKPFTCAKCAQRHKTTDHHLHCSSVLNNGSSRCSCPSRCANCHGTHWATDQGCPEMRKFSLPLAAPAQPPVHFDTPPEPPVITRAPAPANATMPLDP